jgi:hypothetical protein
LPVRADARIVRHSAIDALECIQGLLLLLLLLLPLLPLLPPTSLCVVATK